MSNAAPKPDKPVGLLRSLGRFFGHIVRGATTDPDPPVPDQSVLVKHEVQEESRATPAGTVTLRRTITEEVAIRPDTSSKGD